MILNRYKQSTGRLKAVVVLAALALIVGGLFGWGVGAGAAQAQEVRLPLGGTAAANAPTGLYDTPALDGKLLLTLPLNAQATVMGGPFNEGWYWLDYKGTVGYAPGKTLVVVDANYKPVVLATPTATRTATPVPTNTPTATPKPASPYLNLWVGEMAVRSSVKSGPGSNTSTVKSWWAGRRVLVYAEAKDSTGNLWYRVSDPPEAMMYVQASQVKRVFAVQYENASRFKGKWVNVNLSQQVVTAYQDGAPVKVTLASTGKASTPTELGVQRIEWRVRSQTMRGGTPGVDYYDLPNVEWVQYFNSTGEALHGAYWHDDFGRPRSHGCVNLSNPIAKWFFEWGSIGVTVWVHN